MDIIFRQVLSTADVYFLQAIQIYEESFPPNERQPLSILADRVNQSKSKLYVGLLNDEVVCMALLWDFVNMEFVLLDYMAVKKSHRNNKIGASLFKFLQEDLKKIKKYLIIEVENYFFGANQEQRKKRVNFYINNGAYLLKDVDYILPPLDGSSPTEMFLLLCPRYHKERIDKKDLEKLIIRLYLDLYGKDQHDVLLNKIVEKIPAQVSFENKIIL
jgi:GNAT superfamily N-acetyltransferase